MKLEVKSIWIDSASTSFEDYSPNSKDFFGVWVGFKVGFAGESKCDDFRVLACSPNWLTAEMSSNGATWGRHTLLVKEFSHELIAGSINLLVEKLSENDWVSATQSLSKFVEWEFEDYQK